MVSVLVYGVSTAIKTRKTLLDEDAEEDKSEKAKTFAAILNGYLYW
jgi:ribonuclease PH